MLPSFPERLRRRARRDLERLGVEVRLGTPGRRRRRRPALDLEGDRIEARTKIWAAGVQASPLGRTAGRARGRRRSTAPGRVEVRAGLLAARAPRGVRRRRSHGAGRPPRPGGGRDAERPPRRAHDRPPARGRRRAKPFRYRDLGTMATISRFRAVVEHRAAPGRGLHRMADVARRPPGLPDRVQEPRRRRWPTGPSRSSGAAGASARSPSSRCSPAPAHSQTQDAKATPMTRQAGHAWTPSVQDEQREQTRLALGAMLVPLFFVIAVRALHHRRLPQAASERHQGRRRRAAGADGAAARRPRRRRPARRSTSARWRRSPKRRTTSASETSTRRSCRPRTRSSPRP